MIIKSETETLFDTSRQREIPLKIYLPENSNGKTIIFSHGLGGSAESYKYFGEFMAANGFTSIHPTHIGIDASLLKTKRPFQTLKESADLKENQINPALDIKFILDEMKLNNIALCGHSFGSYSGLLLAGQDVSKKGYDVNFIEPRIKCFVLMSPHAILQSPQNAYDEITAPILHITGNHDNSPFGFFEPIQRRIPYDNIHCGNQYLIVFEKADHMVFAAQRRGNKFSAADIEIMKSTCAASLEFLKKYLLNENSALDTPEFAAKLTTHATFERK